MLVTFSTPAHGDVTMFGDVALQLLTMMGRSDALPSAMYADDVQGALDQLRQAIASTRSSNAPASADDEDSAPDVSLSNRALPLIELLEAAAQAQTTVMWESNE